MQGVLWCAVVMEDAGGALHTVGLEHAGNSLVHEVYLPSVLWAGREGHPSFKGQGCPESVILGRWALQTEGTPQTKSQRLRVHTQGQVLVAWSKMTGQDMCWGRNLPQNARADCWFVSGRWQGFLNSSLNYPKASFSFLLLERKERSSWTNKCRKHW